LSVSVVSQGPVAKIKQQEFTQAVYDTVIRAVTEISPDVKALLEASRKKERNGTAKSMLSSMLENLDVAGAKDKAICQSPGYPTCWVFFGDDGYPPSIGRIVGDAVAYATRKGYLRPSMVDPLTRENTGNNTGKGVPNLELCYVPGQKYIDFYISFKGCGAELGNALEILTPARLGKNLSGLKRFILETVIEAGGKPCPPVGIGIGIGGQMDIAAKISRKVISIRRWDDTNPDPVLASLEEELRASINQLGIGAAGTGGDTYALAVKIDRAHTHTAIAPVAVNFHCWVARRAGIRIHGGNTVERIL
jgi:fumarate hydratase subunit alpha